MVVSASASSLSLLSGVEVSASSSSRACEAGLGWRERIRSSSEESGWRVTSYEFGHDSLFLVFDLLADDFLDEDEEGEELKRLSERAVERK